MKKNYINPTCKVYCFEPEGRVIMASPGAGQFQETEGSLSGGADDSNPVSGGGRGDAASYRNNLWD